MLCIRLFGPLEALVDGTEPPDLRLRMGGHLLAFLALRDGRAVHCDYVAEALWPETASPDSLRASVSHLARALGQEGARIEHQNHTVRLRVDGAEVDLRDFDRAIARGDPASLERAVALHRAPLLQDWDLPWVRAERTKRCDALMDALCSLADQARACGDWHAAARWLGRLSRGRPSRVAVWRDLMDALLRAGERAEVVETFRRCRDHLRRTARVEPPEEVTALYREALRGTPVEGAEVRSDQIEEEPEGGAVPVYSRLYVARPTDGEFHAALARGDGIVLVKGPRQIGKTSLLARGLHEARRRGARVVLTDLQKLDSADMETPAAFYGALATELAEQLGMSDCEPPEWSPRRSPGGTFDRWVRSKVLDERVPPLVWALDEVDRLFGCSFRDDAFGLFRSWYNARALSPDSAWCRLSLVMACATEAALFIADLNRSPFNVGTRVTLEDFTLEEAAELNKRFGSPVDDAASLRQLYALVGGHPYLQRRSLRALRRLGVGVRTLERMAEREDGPFADHLERMLAALMRDPGMTDAVRAVLRGEPCPDPASEARLRSAGLLAPADDGPPRIRCGLYAGFLARRLA